MKERHIETIAGELQLGPPQVAAAVDLLEGGATVPFIARYRKEATGSLDEVAVAAIGRRFSQLIELDSRRESILKSLRERGLLTDALEAQIAGAETLTKLEDLYLPYRPKRKTRATTAREKGLEPLARLLLDQGEETDPAAAAAAFVSTEKEVASAEDALAGARDIIAELAAEDLQARERMRALYFGKGLLRTRVLPGMEDEGKKYRDYFEWEEPGATAPSHRILAMRRGAKEGYLVLSVTVPEEDALGMLETLFIKNQSPAAEQVQRAIQDGFRRLLSPAMETEVRLETKKRADAEAIQIFAGNLRELLLAPPLGQKRVMAIDPGIRTGCKVVCVDRQGQLLHTETVYPFTSERERSRAAETLRALCTQYQVEALAVGNGTGGRETEAFVREAGIAANAQVIMVNESGASVYSASEAARAEFPDLDLTLRGAVSIGRRLMDPLAELVKIDPKSIGVGQYQHDVQQTALVKALDEVVVSCVNAVGVEVNTASEQLLKYVSGLGPQLARNMVSHRNAQGPFRSREALKKVKGMGPKAFEQSAGFLRIKGGDNPLDASAVHPESYPVVEDMAATRGCAVQDLMADGALRAGIDLSAFVTEKVGMPTLKDIMEELARPGRDPRQRFEQTRFADGIEKIGDLEPGMRLPGVVTNVTAFGAFVDVGVHQDGLVHISQLADRFVKDPAGLVKVHQRVMVTVLEVDLERNRISLSMRSAPEKPEKGAAAPSKRERPQKAEKKRSGREPEPFNNPFHKAFREMR